MHSNIIRKLLTLALLCAPYATAQFASLRGQVTDESGAVIPGAKVTLTGAHNFVKTATAANDGSYSFVNLPPGDYTLTAAAPDLAMPQPVSIVLNVGRQSKDLQLKVAVTQQQVTVEENAAPAVSTDASHNASAMVLKGSDLDALADDPEDLAADLQALAGPAAGPNGGSLFVDGFSGGQLPPKESIREIRVNQNPFSPEFDTLGYGRIEVFTKPGADKYRGTLFYNFGDSFWNSRNPYAAQKAPFLLKEYGGNIGGPIGKRASFFLDIQRHAIDNGAIINGTLLDQATLAIVDPFTQVFRVPQRRVIVSPRIDYQLSANNTLTVRYSFSRAEVSASGVGSFNLVSQATDARSDAHTVQITETAVLGSSAVNEMRFQLFRVDNSSVATNPGPTIEVLSAFTGGGSPIGHTSSLQNNYEWQNYTSITRGMHVWRFGVRLRGTTSRNFSAQNFGGTFVFAGGLAPELDANNQPLLDPSGNPLLANIDSIERYRRTLLFQKLGYTAPQIRALGGGATQFTLNSGDPLVTAGQMDLGAFAGDDWRVRSNVTLSLGVRYETQTNIHDWRDFAPRIGVAWAPGGASAKARPKSVIRAGFGMFYDRFGLGNTITALRYNGVLQKSYVFTNPDFFPSPVPPPSAVGSQTSSTIQEISAALRAPHVMQSAVSFERQLPLNSTIAVTYTNAHGLHQLRSAAINSPLPGSFNSQAPASGVFPFGTSGPIFLMESSGIYNQNQLLTNVNTRVNRDISLFGYYVYNRARSNTDGLGTFPANPYNFAGEYAPAATDIHHRVSVGGTIATKWDIRLSPLLTANSGPPFDITVGHDLFGDTLFNGRPGIATDPNKPGVIATRYGLLDPNPTSDEKLLPRNFGRGPGQILLNLRIAKVFGFGGSHEASSGGSGLNIPGGGGPPRGMPSGPFSTGGGSGGPAASSHRFNLSIAMSIRNIFNHNNPGPIIGNIASPLFGQANQPAGVGTLGGTGFSESANNRRLELQTRFTF